MQGINDELQAKTTYDKESYFKIPKCLTLLDIFESVCTKLAKLIVHILKLNVHYVSLDYNKYSFTKFSAY